MPDEYCKECGAHRTWYHYPEGSPRYGKRYLRGWKGMCLKCVYATQIKPYKLKPSDERYIRYKRLLRIWPHLTQAKAAQELQTSTRTIGRYARRWKDESG